MMSSSVRAVFGTVAGLIGGAEFLLRQIIIEKKLWVTGRSVFGQ